MFVKQKEQKCTDFFWKEGSAAALPTSSFTQE